MFVIPASGNDGVSGKEIELIGKTLSPTLFGAILLLFAAYGCGGAARATRGDDSRVAAEDRARAAALVSARDRGALYPHTPADVYFMTGMVPHHAQAVLMSQWAETRASRQDVKVMAQRIAVGQRDEIAMMRTWLRDRKLHVPDSNATHHRMTMDGATHDMLMPGMLSEAEMTALSNTRGIAFDRLFIVQMIKHHEGAIAMVEDLFKSPGAAQEPTVFAFASDVFADQSTEIDRMQRILAAIPPG